MFQLATYPRLCEETERIVAGYIREREEKTKDQVRINRRWDSLRKCVRENSSYIQSVVGQWKIFDLNRLHILERKKNYFFYH